jgi:GTP-binding protein
MIKGTVAIVGSPNVGKSSLFNRIIGQRFAITDDLPGLTRDRIYARAEWLTQSFNVIDTGGIEIKQRPLQEQIRFQSEIAIQEADVIVYVVDGRRGVTPDDRLVASILYRSKKPIVLAVNKIDDGQLQVDINDFYQLGLGEPIAISSLHGIGIGDMLDRVIALLPKDKIIPIKEGTTQFALIGRPNVGKSSLVNAILKQERVIVSPIEGTTRDAIDTTFTFEARDYVIIDTAGLKKRGAIFESVDKYAALRSLKAIDRCDVAVIVINADEGLLEQDKHIAGYAFEAHKAMVVVVNKWDLAKKGERDIHQYTKQLRAFLPFLEFAEIVYTSHDKANRLPPLMKAIDLASANYQQRIPTARFNEVLVEAQLMNQTPEFNGGRLKIYYGEQVANKPPTFVLFCNHPNYMHFSYKRYLENRLRETFHFEGTPIRFITRERK